MRISETQAALTELRYLMPCEGKRIEHITNLCTYTFPHKLFQPGVTDLSHTLYLDCKTIWFCSSIRFYCSFDVATITAHRYYGRFD